jgi:hypothetical protein
MEPVPDTLEGGLSSQMKEAAVDGRLTGGQTGPKLSTNATVSIT